MRLLQAFYAVGDVGCDLQFGIEQRTRIDSQPFLIGNMIRYGRLFADVWQHGKPEDSDGRRRHRQTSESPDGSSYRHDASSRITGDYFFNTSAACGKTFSNMIQAINRVSARLSDWPQT